ncbi:hypothetical protein B5P44_00870 [Mycobacterium sp. CBMA 213]|uniref:Uncharacterized protein n=1 Tax=Mycolicibacterium sp. CBMA 213 TaxID=1968788 RepID=A0A343VRG1_9MYCO|nr:MULTISPECIES: hypothetical protein [unclassified Mycolicibacterium]AVN58485.1 hypothetical protein B5P44_p00190 [Mycolicibacterium sp. CBMA 213]MUL61135.1 hypothetical protein [Mycolicibacterium sp. CBMA 335]MUM03373.1 hypothetical protein [Mycolicibacterium sp. CBMA 213]
MSDQDGSKPEPETDPIHPVAAVYDTSFFSAGRFKPELIEQLAGRLARRDVTLWIPAQVIDEWAVHAFEALTELKAAHAKLGGLTIAGEPPEPLSARDIAAHIDQLCRAMPNVEVLTLDGQCAIDAIRDQVLGEGAGGRSKDGTRTGAVDSSIVRDALRRVDNDPDQLVFLTRNLKDFQPAAKALGHSEFPAAVNTRHLFARLSQPTHPKHAVDTARRLIIEELLHNIKDASAADDRHGPPPAWIDVNDITVAAVDTDDQREFESIIDPSFELEPAATLVYVANVGLQVIDEDTDLVSYTVVLLTDVRAEGYVINNDGNTVHKWMTLYDSIVTVPFDADIVDGKLLQPRQSDTATARSSLQQFDDEWDAYQDVWETISAWEGITVKPAKDDALPIAFELHGPDRQRVDAEVPGKFIAGEWTLEFTSPDMELTTEISSQYDPNSRAWLGREESYDMYPPYYLVSGARRARPGPYLALALVWQYLVDKTNQPAPDDEDA